MITLQEIRTIFFDEDAIRLPPYRVGRFSIGNGRGYFKLPVVDEPILYTSLTTAIGTCSPMEEPLKEWWCRHGIKEAGRLLQMYANYGTLMHETIGDYCIKQVFDFDKCDQIVEDYLSRIGYYQPECAGWAKELRKDMAAWIQFTLDYQLKCIAVEMVLCSNRGYATSIDVVCDMTVMDTVMVEGRVISRGKNKGKPKEIKKKTPIRERCLINMKSGRHGFYRVNAIQLEAEKALFEENFPEIKIKKIFNWSPKEWTSAPGYNLKDQSGQISQKELSAVMDLADERFGKNNVNKEKLFLHGEHLYGNSLSGNLFRKTIAQIIKDKYVSQIKSSDQMG